MGKLVLNCCVRVCCSHKFQVLRLHQIDEQPRKLDISKFYLRLKCDALVTHKENTQQAGEWFKSSRERKLEHCTVYGQVLSLAGKTIQDGRDVLIVATNASLDDALKFIVCVGGLKQCSVR